MFQALRAREWPRTHQTDYILFKVGPNVQMDRLVDEYYRVADLHDVYYNDIVMRHDVVHSFFYVMGIRLSPMRIAHCIYIMDPHDLGYVTLDSVKKLFYGPI